MPVVVEVVVVVVVVVVSLQKSGTAATRGADKTEVGSSAIFIFSVDDGDFAFLFQRPSSRKLAGERRDWAPAGLSVPPMPFFLL
jgi:hypothetical protein